MISGEVAPKQGPSRITPKKRWLLLPKLRHSQSGASRRSTAEEGQQLAGEEFMADGNCAEDEWKENSEGLQEEAVGKVVTVQRPLLQSKAKFAPKMKRRRNEDAQLGDLIRTFLGTSTGFG